MGRTNRQGIVATAKFDNQGFKVPIGNTAGHGLPGNGRIQSHTQSIQPILCEGSGIIGQAVAVINHQGINLYLFIYPHIGVHGIIKIAVQGNHSLFHIFEGHPKGITVESADGEGATFRRRCVTVGLI